MINYQQVDHGTVFLLMRSTLVLILALAFARPHAAEPIVVTTPFWTFAASEGWGIWWPEADQPQPYTVEHVADGLRLTLAPGSDELRLNLWSERYKSGGPLGASEAVLIEVELIEGQASIGLDLYDAKQEGLHYADRVLVPGIQTVTWELADQPQHSWGDQRDLVADAPLGVWGIGIGRGATTEPTVLLLRAGQRRERAHAADLISVTLDTGSPIHLLQPNATPVLVFANRAGTPVRVEIDVSDEDWAGAMQTAKATVTVPVDGLRWSFPTTPKTPKAPTTRGIHWIECAIADVGDQEPRVSERLPYAVLATPVKRPKDEGFLFGVVGGIPGPGPDSESYLASAVESLRWLGLRYIRTGVNWEYVERAPGQWNDAHLDWFSQAIDRFGAVGTRIQFLLCYCTRYAAAKEKQDAANHLDWMFSPPDLDAWRAYVAKMVARYGDRVRLWEAWNEADIEFWRGSVEQYQALLRVTHEEVKRGDPTRLLMNSGFAFAWRRDGNPIAEVPYRVSKESRADYDILAYHLHHQFGEYRHILEGPLADVRAQAGDPPLLFNECAVNLDVFGERGQAEQLPKKLLFAWSKGAIGYFWYNLTGGLRRPSPGHDRNWGLLTEDFHPRAVFCAYHTLMELLADATFGGRLATAKDRYVMRFDTPEGQVVAAWDEDARASGEPLVITVGAGARCTAVDLMGVRTPLPTDGGVCLMPVGSTPNYVLIEGATAPITLAKTVIHIDRGVVAVPGRTTTVRVALANPLDRAATMLLAWDDTPGIGAIAPMRVELGPGASRAVGMEMPVAADDAPRLGRIIACSLEVTIEGSPLSSTVPVPVMLVMSLSSGAFERRADIALADRAAVVDLHANVPQRQQRMWTGPEDQSVQAWLGRQGDRLALRVIVRDDRHVQAHVAGDAWQGDSLQFAFAVPGAGDSWEFTLARSDADGAALVANGIRPPGAADATDATMLATTRIADRTTYEASWPIAALGLDETFFPGVLPVGLLVNDDDGEGRDGWIELSPGIGMTKDSSMFPLVIVE